VTLVNKRWDEALLNKTWDEVAPHKDPGALLMMREGAHAMLAGKFFCMYLLCRNLS